MEQVTKICAMCRKSVDQAAMICPHCRSDINYWHFIDITDAQIIRERKPLRKTLSIIISIVFVGIVGFIGIVLAGFWAGIGFALFAGALTAALSNMLRVDGYDMAQLTCNSCGHGDNYRWDGGTFEPGKQAHFDCSSCKQRTRLMVASSRVAISSQYMNQ